MIKNIIIGVVMLVVGFFAGMEYKAYQVRTAITNAFTAPTTQIQTSDTTTKSNSVIEQAKKDNEKVIEKTLADEVTLGTIKFKVNKVEEKQTISSSYGTPKVAKAGTKELYKVLLK